MTAGRRWALLAAAAVLIGAAGGMVRSTYVLGMLIFIALNGMAALGLSLVMGFAGQVSLGQAAFYAIGAYVSGVLTASMAGTAGSPWSRPCWPERSRLSS